MELKLNSKIRKGLVLKMSDLLLDVIKLMFGGVILTGIMGLVDNILMLVIVGGIFIVFFLVVASFLYIVGSQDNEI